MGDTLDVAQTHWQQRLGAVEGLDLGFLVNAEHNRLMGRVEVEADDVSSLLDKERIVGELVVAVRLSHGDRVSGSGAAGRRSAAGGAPHFWRCR